MAPRAAAVTAASSATGRSEVPAHTTATSPHAGWCAGQDNHARFGVVDGGRDRLEDRPDVALLGPGREHRPAAGGESGEGGRGLLGALARTVDRLGLAGP